MSIPASGRLIAAATAAILCLASPVAAPASAAAHHKTHHPAKKAKKRLTLAAARSTALASAAPLILDPADQVAVTGCAKVSSASYSCGLRLQAASSSSVCQWTVVVALTARGPDVSNYSHVNCAG